MFISVTPLQGKYCTPGLEIQKWGTGKLSGVLETTQWTKNWIQLFQIPGHSLNLVDVINIYSLTKIEVFSSSEQVCKDFLKHLIFSQITKISIFQNLDKHLTEM